MRAGRRPLRTAVLALVGAATILGPSCSSSDPPQSSQAGSSPGSTQLVPAAPSYLRYAPVDTGVLSASTPTPPAANRSYPAAGPRIAVALHRCRTSWPGHLAFDLTWTPPPDLALPASMTLVLGTGESAGSSTVDVALTAPGAFTVVVDVPLVTRQPGSGTRADEPRAWVADRRVLATSRSGACGVQVRASRAVEVTNESRGVEVDAARPTVVAPDASVESLLDTVDPFALDDPLAPLVALLADPTWPAFDQLWIAPEDRLASIAVRQDATCLGVTSTYGDDPGAPRSTPDGTAPPQSTVTVSQRIGCPGHDEARTAVGDPDEIVRIVDREWDVEVKGPARAVGELIARLRKLPVTSRGTAHAAPFDPDAFLDAWLLQRPDRRELGRASWEGGRVALILGESEVSAHPVITVEGVAALPGAPVGRGSSGTNCRDQAVAQQITSQRGYVAIVARDNVASVEYRAGGELRTVELVPSRQPGFRFGFIGDPPRPAPGSASSLTLRYLDAAGHEVPCVQ